MCPMARVGHGRCRARPMSDMLSAATVIVVVFVGSTLLTPLYALYRESFDAEASSRKGGRTRPDSSTTDRHWSFRRRTA
jgi:hypothetical protein